MSIWEKLEKAKDLLVEKGPDIVDAMYKASMKQHSEMTRKAESKILEYERKLESAENSNKPKTKDQQQKHKEAREKLQNAKIQVYGTEENTKLLQDWEREWTSIGPLASADLSPYNHAVGIYRHWYQGRVVYIGRAIELRNGGFRKRLSDYRRDSDSARKHKSGRLIYEHLNRINTDIIVVGNDDHAVMITRKLEAYLIGKYNPEWNTLLK